MRGCAPTIEGMSSPSPQDRALIDPRKAGARPPYPQPRQVPPGDERQMQPRPDCGEDTWRGLDRLRGRRALITGGDSGIGRAIAIAYAREGADVAFAHLASEHGDSRETVAAIERAGRRALAIPGDITERAHCDHLVERVVAAFGAIDSWSSASGP